jgi:hypothetical protein
MLLWSVTEMKDDFLAIEIEEYERGVKNTLGKIREIRRRVETQRTKVGISQKRCHPKSLKSSPTHSERRH